MANAAFEALKKLASLSRNSAVGLPEQLDVAPRWSGIGFETMGHRMVVTMGQISELLDLPSSTRLPGVQPWVMGLANVRGRLLPLFDLARFLGGHVHGQRKTHRVLVWESDDMYSGIVVDRAFGMQHFIADTFVAETEQLPESLSQYVSGYYADAKGQKWNVFDMSALAADPDFINASAA
ncbi:MAG: chemotaxis protein CheW [Agarilytica sp.]